MKQLIYLAALLAAVAYGQDAGAISGQVADGATGNPINGAVVVATGENGQVGRALTNERGAYRIGELAPGQYRVTAEASGFEPASFPDPVGVRAGQVTPDINFRLRPSQPPPQGGISGRVVDGATGEPILGAIVVATGRAGAGRALTNERGAYVIEGLAAGQYGVTAEARGYEPARYPDPVGVRESQVTPNIDLSLRPSQPPPQGGISGRVVDGATGQPVFGAIVVATGRAGAGRALTNERGAYVIEGLAAGQYEVTAEAAGYQPTSYPDPVGVREGQVTPNIDFSLRPSQPPPRGGISGRVVDGATGEPIVGAVVVATGENGRMGRALTNERGAYLIDGLAAGRYRVTAEARGYEPARYPDPVGVREGQVTPNIDFRLRPQQQQQGGISGRVTARRTGEPIVGAMVEATSRLGTGRARTNERGVYVIEGLAAGEYHVHVRARDYLPERFPRPVPVRAGEVTGDINFELRPSIAVQD